MGRERLRSLEERVEGVWGDIWLVAVGTAVLTRLYWRTGAGRFCGRPVTWCGRPGREAGGGC